MFQAPKGMKDIDENEMRVRNVIYNKIKKVLINYGFEFVEPSFVENFNTLSAKSGKEIEKEIYVFKDKSNRKLGLRFDLTVGIARMVASSQRSLPIKLCAIAPMWRYDNPQFGRYRCFWQWDAEIIGCKHLTADAEIISLSIEIMNSFNLATEVKINNRKLIEGLLLDMKVKDITNAMRVIDKIEKVNKDELKKEFKSIGIKERKIEQILELTNLRYRFNEISELKKISNNKCFIKGVRELEELYKALECFEIEKNCIIDLSVVRGLDYYTGVVYEIWSTNKNLGAVAGGGRYDELLKIYGKDLPATGVAGGIERLILALRNENKLPRIKKQIILVTYVNKKLFPKAIEILQMLRKSNCNATIDLSMRNFRNQFNYANAMKFPYVIIVGDKDLKEHRVTLRNMRTGEEEKVKLEILTTRISELNKAKI